MLLLSYVFILRGQCSFCLKMFNFCYNIIIMNTLLHYLIFVLNICWSADHLGSLGSGGGPQSSCFQSSQVGRLVSDRVETIWFDWLANSVETSVTTGKNIWIQTNYEKNEIDSFCLFVFCCCTIRPVSYFVCCFHFRNPLPPLWHFITDIFHTIFSFAIESCVYETDFTLLSNQKYNCVVQYNWWLCCKIVVK